MTRTTRNTSSPRLRIDPAAIAARLETLDDTRLCTTCQQAITPVAADTVAALAEAIRLWNALALARLESANQLAAIRAALHAHAEGETDPPAYLRDELPGERPGNGGRWCR